MKYLASTGPGRLLHKSFEYMSHICNRNTLWFRDTVRQTSLGMSAWPFRETTKYSFYPVQTYKLKQQ